MAPAIAWMRAATGLAAIYLVAHLLQLAPDLGDIDSINFALGLRHFDPVLHQPHPPGYPVYMVLGRLTVAILGWLTPDVRQTVLEARALAVWSALGGAVALAAATRLWVELQRVTVAATQRRSVEGALWSTALLMANALFWVSGSRPMSDMPGLAAAIAAQAMLLASVPDREGRGGRAQALLAGALLSGLAIGLRTQTLWLTAPLLVTVVLLQARDTRLRSGVRALGLAALGSLAWAVPLVVATGGPGAYLAALGSQAGDDLAFVDMVYTHPTLKALALALYRTFVLPWGVDLRAPDTEAVAKVLVQGMLVMAAAGAVRLGVTNRRQLALLAVAFVPYLAFHLLLQETITVRYALPTVPLVALLVAEGAGWLGRTGRGLVVAAAAAALAVSVPHTLSYAAAGNGASQAMRAIAAEAPQAQPAFLATHITLTRSAQAAAVPGLELRPPRVSGNWLELMTYWGEGGTRAVWFLADPSRFDLDSIDPAARRDVSRFERPASAYPELSGSRPSSADWYRIPPPRWVVGEGWALSPETGGVTASTNTGPHLRPIRALVRRDLAPARLTVGGRSLAGPDGGAVTIALAIDGRPVDAWPLAAGQLTFLRFVDVPAESLAGAGAYATVTVTAAPVAGRPPVPVAITQFSAVPATDLSWGLADGWHDDEVDRSTASRFRWSTERAALDVRGAARGVRVLIAGASPLHYLDAAPEVRLLAGGQIVGSQVPSGDFELDARVSAAALAAAGGRLELTTSRTFTPFERGESLDRRRLGLRIVRIELLPEP